MAGSLMMGSRLNSPATAKSSFMPPGMKASRQSATMPSTNHSQILRFTSAPLCARPAARAAHT